MKAKDIVKLDKICERSGIPVHIAIAISKLYLGQKVDNEDYEEFLLGHGYIDEDKMLTDKALSLDFIGIIKCNKENEELANSIRDIFPKTIIKTSGKPARSPVSEICTKIKWFKENYEYSDDQILKAAENYVQFYEAKDYNYMQTSSYFISKQDNDKNKISTLASWCENLGEDYKNENFEINV